MLNHPNDGDQNEVSALSGIAGVRTLRCTNTNTSINNLQFSGETQPFPTNYRDQAARAVLGLPATTVGTLQVSYPQTILGQNVFDPKRWYVCIRGQKGAVMTYQAVLVLEQGTRPWLMAKPGQELCGSANYEAVPPASP